MGSKLSRSRFHPVITQPTSRQAVCLRGVGTHSCPVRHRSLNQLLSPHGAASFCAPRLWRGSGSGVQDAGAGRIADLDVFGRVIRAALSPERAWSSACPSPAQRLWAESRVLAFSPNLPCMWKIFAPPAELDNLRRNLSAPGNESVHLPH